MVKTEVYTKVVDHRGAFWPLLAHSPLECYHAEGMTREDRLCLIKRRRGEWR